MIMPKPIISIGELIDQSWDVYRSRFWELLTISGWLMVTAILNAIALALYPSASKLQLGAELTGVEITGVLLFSATTLIITPLLSFWIYTSLVRALNAHFTRQRIDPKMAMREGRDVFFPALLTSIMVVLMVLLAIVIGFAPPVILAAIASLTNLPTLVIIANILLVIGVFVALVLSIKWVVYYLLAPIITILDSAQAKQALIMSRQLIQGRFFAVLARVAVPKLVFVIFGVFAMSIIAYLVGILIDASSGLNLDIQLRLSTMTQSIIPILIAILINPLILISDVLLLRSLKNI